MSAQLETYDRYQAKRDSLSAELRAADNQAAPVGLAKDTSNLFRDRETTQKRRLEVRDFNRVLAIDTDAGTVEVEGMTPYGDLVDATLAHGLMPAVVPELRSITIGGAVSGVGIESSSFRYGLPHETVTEMDVLLADGSVVTCTPGNEHSDLYYGLANSYGTLGYVLRLKARTVPVAPFVELTHVHHDDPRAFFADVERTCARGDVDFVDGTVFEPDEHYLTIGRFVHEAPWTSDYTYEHMYYRSIRRRERDYLTTRDYIWRWDTDWFWCSKNVGAQNPVLRRLFGRSRLNSVFYTRVMRLNARWKLMASVNRLRGIHTESVIQDVDVPAARAAEFLEFFHREIGIRPVWICPARSSSGATFPLFRMDPDTLYINFGFWDVIRRRTPIEPGEHNRRIERKVGELGGIKSLYSDAYYDEDEFWRIYNRPAYDELKARYDPRGRFQDLYEKCVLRR